MVLCCGLKSDVNFWKLREPNFGVFKIISGTIPLVLFVAILSENSKLQSRRMIFKGAVIKSRELTLLTLKQVARSSVYMYSMVPLVVVEQTSFVVVRPGQFFNTIYVVQFPSLLRVEKQDSYSLAQVLEIQHPQGDQRVTRVVLVVPTRISLECRKQLSQNICWSGKGNLRSPFTSVWYHCYVPYRFSGARHPPPFDTSHE